MKRKYFLRGLGLGLITASLMFAFAFIFYKPTLSESEIKKQAKALGMVESTDNKNSSNQSTDKKDSDKKKSESDTDSKDDSNSLDTTTTESKTDDNGAVTNTVTNPDGSTTTTTSIPGDVSKLGDKSATTNSGKNIVISVAGGENSAAVSLDLFHKGLVSDNAEFDKYIESTGKDNSIRPGTYEIPEGSTYAQIADIITTRKK
jgi:cytoskeletal protein RodZ